MNPTDGRQPAMLDRLDPGQSVPSAPSNTRSGAQPRHGSSRPPAARPMGHLPMIDVQRLFDTLPLGVDHGPCKQTVATLHQAAGFTGHGDRRGRWRRAIDTGGGRGNVIRSQPVTCGGHGGHDERQRPDSPRQPAGRSLRAFDDPARRWRRCSATSVSAVAPHDKRSPCAATIGAYSQAGTSRQPLRLGPTQPV